MSALATSYESHRRRLAWLEHWPVLWGGASAPEARREVARKLHLTPDQVRNIRKGRLKDIGAAVSARIDGLFIALAERAKRDLDHELAMASTSARGIDPGVVARAKESQSALAALIKEAEDVMAAKAAPRAQGDIDVR